ncbi:MAG: hypothetical protein ACOYNZ_00055 [Rhodoferax sp.]
MLTLHLPKKFEPISKSLEGSDPVAWIVGAVAGASLIAILAAAFFR